LLSSLSTSLTTNQSVYLPGQPIQMTFTETNTSRQPVTVDNGPSIDGFDVTQNGKPVWESNAGVNPLYILIKTLQPGQSLTLDSTWNGVPNPGQPPIPSGGTFTVTNQLDPQGASATFHIEPSLSSSLTTDHSVYQAGEPIAITFTETNTSSYPAVVLPSGSFTVTNDATYITVFSQSVDQNAPILTLQPGQSLTQTATWNPMQPGMYGLSYQNGNVATDGTVGVTPASSAPAPPAQDPPPVAETLATNLQAYRTGHTVVMTLTLKNASSQSVAITPNPSSDGFSVLSGSTKVWHSARNTRATKARTLLPGESITLRSVWNRTSNQRGTKKLAAGLYTVEASMGGYSASATIAMS